MITARPAWSLPLALPLALVAIACTGQINEDSSITGSMPVGAGEAGTTGSAGEAGSAGTGAAGMPAECAPGTSPGHAPLRRLTRFEYNNSVRDLLDDTTNPGSQLPSEVLASTFDLFGNNADAQSVSWPLIKAYSSTAAEIAARVTANASVMAKLDPCTTSVTAENQDSCARTLIERFARRAYRRVVAGSEVDELFALYQAGATTFGKGVATVIEAVLQSPDYLYRLESGVNDPAHPAVLRPSGDEMASRLSYTLWGTMPDDALRAAAEAGELDTPEGVRAQAARLLDDPRAHSMVRFFFDKLLPIEGLSDITRDTQLFPNFSPTIGAYMREETQRFLEAEIFDSGGTWKSILTAPYTYVNAPLAAFYGMTGVTGDTATYQKVPLDTTQRIGLLMQGGVMTGTIPTNTSNPVRRGGFVLNAMLCRHVSLPTDPAILALVQLPEVGGDTARERFTSHSTQPVCRTCHQHLDPLGFALENFDAVGQYREQDNGHTIDASGELAGLGSFKNGVELARALAEAEETHACFVSHWMEFAYGHLLKEEDACAKARLTEAFKASGYSVKQLLIELTQSDAFLYMPAVRE